jgi:hypothetical protein
MQRPLRRAADAANRQRVLRASLASWRRRWASERAEEALFLERCWPRACLLGDLATLRARFREWQQFVVDSRRQRREEAEKQRYWSKIRGWLAQQPLSRQPLSAQGDDAESHISLAATKRAAPLAVAPLSLEVLGEEDRARGSGGGGELKLSWSATQLSAPRGSLRKAVPATAARASQVRT